MPTDERVLISEENEIDLFDLLGLIWSRIFFVILSAIVVGLAGFVISTFVLPKQYQSTTTVYVLAKQNESAVSASDVQMSTQLSKDCVQMIKSRTVIEAVIEDLELPYSNGQLSSKIAVNAPIDTRVVSITVKDTDPYIAQRIADAVRERAIEHMKSVMELDGVNTSETAYFSDNPSSPSVKIWTIGGFVLGAVIYILIIFLLYMFDDTIKSPDDIEKYLMLSTLAIVPLYDNKAKNTKIFSRDKKRKSK